VPLEGLLEVPSRLAEDDRFISPFLYEGDLIDRTGASELPGLVDHGIDLDCILTLGIEVQTAEDVVSVNFERNIVEDSHIELVSRFGGPIRGEF
jgi:hypothetical protein